MSKQFNLEIELGNDAMQTAEDVARSLYKVAGRLRNGHEDGVIKDINGNTVGKWYGEFDEEEEGDD